MGDTDIFDRRSGLSPDFAPSETATDPQAVPSRASSASFHWRPVANRLQTLSQYFRQGTSFSELIHSLRGWMKRIFELFPSCGPPSSLHGVRLAWSHQSSEVKQGWYLSGRPPRKMGAANHLSSSLALKTL